MLKGLCHEIDIFKGLNIIVCTFCVCVDGFKGLQKSFAMHWTIITFLFASSKLLILKMLTETLLIILLCDCSMLSSSSVNPSWAAGKMCKNTLVTGGFRYDFTESLAASFMHFKCQNRRFDVFEEGY
jgi:hypothetical protein